MVSVAKAVELLTTPSCWPALAKGVAPTVEHRSALQGYDFATVIDVGANKGQFAYFASTQWPEAQIHCFEPIPAPARQLKRLLKDRVQLYPTALGATRSTARLHIASRNDSSSLLPLAQKQKDLFQMEEVGTLEVPVLRLDEWFPSELQQPILLKIDVQGFEFEVLKGAEAILPLIKVVYVEASFVELYSGQKLASDVATYMKAAGFSHLKNFNQTYDSDGTLIQADQVFINDAVAQRIPSENARATK